VLFTVGLVNRFGPKRIMFVSWIVRNFLICAVFLIPFATKTWGAEAGWYVLMGTTLAFCIARAFGAGAWLPWLHEIVPGKQTGLFFSMESIVAQGISVLVLLSQAYVLSKSTTVNTYLYIYAIGIAIGFMSLVAMLRIPGGNAAPDTDTLRGGLGSYKKALSDRPFVMFLLTASLGLSCFAWFGSAWIMYMRDVLEFSSGHIMALTAAGGVGIMFTIRAWGRFADHRGSGHAMSNVLFGHSIAALSFWFILPDTPGKHFAALPGVLACSIFCAAYLVSANTGNLNRVKKEGRVGYTNAWALSTSLAMGITPILAGLVIDRFGLTGYRMCFSISGIGGFACAIACRFLLTAEPPAKAPITSLINPILPLRTFARVMWITLGLHESNKPVKTTTDTE